MNAVSTRASRHQSIIACAVSSVPLSIRMLAGQRPVSAMTSSRTATVASAVNERAARVANASRVNSSITLRNRSCRPSEVTSHWKSSAHT